MTIDTSSQTFKEAQTIFWLNTILAFFCSASSATGAWPFKGFLCQWAWPNKKYEFNMHVALVWFSVGCMGLFCTNLQAYLNYKESTGIEAFQMVYAVNCVMHGLWGMNNLQITYKTVAVTNEMGDRWRRCYPMLGYSILGACGSAFLRNMYAALYGPNSTVTLISWIWEWCSLLIILLDFLYFITKEFQFGATLEEKESVSEIEIK